MTRGGRNIAALVSEGLVEMTTRWDVRCEVPGCGRITTFTEPQMPWPWAQQHWAETTHPVRVELRDNDVQHTWRLNEHGHWEDAV